jgi:tripartite-type tricarboxylate transporter receptor subunit TctC
LKNTSEIVVGTVGTGNATHLTALEIGKKYNVPVRLIPFKSNLDAFINLAGNNGVNFTIERLSTVQNFKQKNSNIKILGLSCTTRSPHEPSIKTLSEQGINVPSVFNVIVSNRQMSEIKRKTLGRILDESTKMVGNDEIMKISDMRSPVFDSINVEDFFNDRFNSISNIRKRHSQAIQ